MIVEDQEKLNLILQGKLSEDDPANVVEINIIMHEGVEVFHIQLMYLQLFTPLYENIGMGPTIKINEPNERLIIVN